MNEYHTDYKKYLDKYNRDGSHSKIRTTIYIDEKLWKKFKKDCKVRDTTPSKVIEKYLIRKKYEVTNER